MPESSGPTADPPAVAIADLRATLMRQCRETIAVKEKFFAEQADRIVACSTVMARAFDQGARLYVMGNGGSSCDAVHTSVEFMHPIIEKRPALPCLSLTTDMAVLTAIGNDQDFSMTFVEQLRMLARTGDMALGISTSGKSPNILRALRTARQMGMTTIGFAGRDGGKLPETCDWCFVVPSFSIPRIQETHQTLLHIVWDLIHIVRGEEDVL
jgi:D-sedoheptulose 7-phosphate isomerase